MEAIVPTLLNLAAKALFNSGKEHVVKTILNSGAKLSPEAIIELANCVNDEDVIKEKVSLEQQEEAKKALKFLSKNENQWNRILAQLKPVDHRGAMFLGPSGAGKTTLVNAFVSGEIKESKLSTPGIKEIYTTICNEVVCVRDTPGRIRHQDSNSMLIDECLRYPPKILCLVLANSYLETVDDPLLQRGHDLHNQAIKFDNKDEYLKYTKKEEMDWLEAFVKKTKCQPPKIQIQHIVIVANKMDLWGDKYEQVKDNYTNNPIIEKLVSILANSYQKAHFLGVSSNYDSFVGQSPIEGASKQKSRFSVLLLRAYLADLLKKTR
ncbi:50S ribosome-binding GTPase [Fortiea sp. LEGE XX443]|uniref:GTPase n=1 Tax=Fortiea sp. LEGE XX443 TaxID=1828611 RepID=UPI001882486C|nr:GTPase [Fortiea sp. LEGE XX443]MBE9005211.1 50S ribosome-binding GTPase [Fortiea sp. LEGE XX443]